MISHHYVSHFDCRSLTFVLTVRVVGILHLIVGLGDSAESSQVVDSPGVDFSVMGEGSSVHTTVSDGNNADFIDVQVLIEPRALDDLGLGTQSQLAVLSSTTLEDLELFGGWVGEDRKGLRSGLAGSGLAGSGLAGSGLGSSGLGVGASSLGGRLNCLIALALLVEDLGNGVGGNGSKRIVGVLLGCHGNCSSPVIQAVR
jgi:hypothetical protein